MMSVSKFRKTCLLLIAGTSLLSGVAAADHVRAEFVLDGRYHHNHYYPPRGYAVRGLPRGYYVAHHPSGSYYFSGGVWYRPYGPRFVVVAPPVGLFVPVLPSFYSTLWVGGSRYYYADDTYYVDDPDQRGYRVVEHPNDADVREDGGPPPPASAPAASGPSDDLFIYPKNGQDQKKQDADRYECHRWAATQTGFDPSEPGGGVGGGQSSQKSSDYFRAMTACLEARGYSVK
jgi:hypothetical protein